MTGIPLLDAAVRLAKERKTCTKCQLASYCNKTCKKEHATLHNRACEVCAVKKAVAVGSTENSGPVQPGTKKGRTN